MFRLPFAFIFTGLVCFVLFQLLTLSDLAGWMLDEPRGPAGWSRIHLLVLGWATMIAMGAVYQLINVVLQSTIYSEKLGFVHFGFFTVGTTGLLLGFGFMKILWIAGFATLALIGILLFAWNIGLTLLRARQWNAITLSTACAVAYLVLTGLSGMAMGLNFGFNLWGGMHERLLHAHIWLGALGWFGLLITGFTYKMLPMFYLSHDFPVRLQTVTLVLWNAGVVTGAASLLFEWPRITIWFGLLLIVLAILAFNLHISQIIRRRHKSQPGSGIRWSVWSARALLGAGALILILSLLIPDVMLRSETIGLLGWTYLWGWVALTILGYLSKIVPFLWWTHKYGPRVGRGKTPTMGQLIDDRFVHAGLTVMSGSLLVLLLGLGFQAALVTAAGGSILALGSMGYIGLVARVFTR